MEMRKIPVIYYNEQIGAWDPFDRDCKASKVAAAFKNETTEEERRKLLAPGRDGELHALRNERRRAAMPDMESKKKSRILSVLPFFLLIGVVVYILWLNSVI